ncbi:FHA domain-containing protein [bacterium]|nr:FHA domain-containing protein [bacterium]
MAEVQIKVVSGVSSGDIFRFNLDSGSSVKIGRAQDNDVVLDDQAVSRKHAEVRLLENKLVLVDVGSSHGTFHMGFQVPPRDQSGRVLKSGDEFKIGDTIFCVGYNAPKEAQDERPQQGLSAARANLGIKFKNKKILYPLIVLAALALAALLVMPAEKKSALPTQHSDLAVQVPSDAVIGFINAGGGKGQSDQSRADKAVFTLPASDLLVEAEYINEAVLDIKLDEGTIESIDPNTKGWAKLAILIRDSLTGKDRKLVFDNTSYPFKKQQDGQTPKRYGVRSTRATPLSRMPTDTVEQRLATLRTSLDTMDTSAHALFNTIRAAQRLVIELLTHFRVDASLIKISTESTLPSAVELRARIDSLLQGFNNATLSPTQIIKQASALLADLDSELWRRAQSRFIKAKLASQAKNYIDAYDHLVAVKAMIPDESDERWVIAQRLFSDDKIVPKKVRLKPEKYRKN